MPSIPPIARVLLLGLLHAALGRAAWGATDPRVLVCAEPCALVLKSANGTIDVKDLLASPTLKTLYREGDVFQVEANRKYALMLRESKDGFYDFELQLVPQNRDSTWTFRIKTIPTEPFISVVDEGWSKVPGKVVVQTDRTKPLIMLESAPAAD
jgi:hypothetical protein